MTESPVERPLRIFLSACAAISLFAVMNVLVKIAMETQSVPQALFFRNLIGMLPVLFLMSRAADGFNLVKTKHHTGHFIRSFVGLASMGCFFWSFALLPLADATALHFAAPLILTALSVPLLKEHVGPHRWAAVAVGLGAVLFMIGPAGNGNMLGAVVALSAAFLSAFAMIAIRKLGRTENSLTIVFYFTLYGIVITGVAMMFAWTPIDARALLLLIGVGLAGGVGQIFLTYCYANAPAAYVSPFNYLAIVFAAGFDFLIWATVPDWRIAAGSSVVIATGLYIVFREARKQHEMRVRTSLYAMQPTQPTEEDRKQDQASDKAA